MNWIKKKYLRRRKSNAQFLFFLYINLQSGKRTYRIVMLMKLFQAPKNLLLFCWTRSIHFSDLIFFLLTNLFVISLLLQTFKIFDPGMLSVFNPPIFRTVLSNFLALALPFYSENFFLTKIFVDYPLLFLNPKLSFAQLLFGSKHDNLTRIQRKTRKKKSKSHKFAILTRKVFIVRNNDLSRFSWNISYFTANTSKVQTDYLDRLRDHLGMICDVLSERMRKYADLCQGWVSFLVVILKKHVPEASIKN